MNHPELLLLGFPALFLVIAYRGPKLILFLRIAVVVLLTLAAADPRIGDSGRDVVVLVDRSASMPGEVNRQAAELIRLVEGARSAGDRIAVLSFGRSIQLDQALQAEGQFAGFASEVDSDGSSLGMAIERALALIPADRAASLLVLSDGLATDIISTSGATARGIPIFARQLARDGSDSIRVRRLSVPPTVAEGEPLAIEAQIQAAAAGNVPFRLVRDGLVIREGMLPVTAGINRVVWRDILSGAGIAQYHLEVGAGSLEDKVPENNTALAPVKIEAPRSILLINQTGKPDALSNALTAAKLPIVLSDPESAPLSSTGLAAFQLVIIEDVPAGRLGAGLDVLAGAVSEQGKGLLMTGGPASFAVGGYLHSPLEKVLPVRMELEQNQRNGGLALVVALDRSGSMAVSVGGGLVKMDLANAGTVAAIESLTSMDSVAVMAVDTEAHLILPMTEVSNPAPLVAKVKGIESMGGGIFVNAAVRVAAELLAAAPQPRRHLLLFADAADAEAHEGVAEMVTRMASAGITTSVVALGTPSDPDAQFLQETATLGQGQIFFSTDPTELPRIFALDTMLSTDSAFVREQTLSQAGAGLYMLGGLSVASAPVLGGYNRTRLKSGASLGIATVPKEEDKPEPVLAWQVAGLGRAGAFMGQVGGEYGAGVVSWSEFSRTMVTLARWLGNAETAPEGWFAGVRREGGRAVVSVEAPGSGLGEEVALRVRDPGSGAWESMALTPTGVGKWEASLDLKKAGVYLGVASVGSGENAKVLELPPMALPASPEFLDLDVEAGRRRLEALAGASGGEVDGRLEAVFEGPGSSSGRSLRTFFAASALVLLLVEILVRRLSLAGWIQEKLRRTPAPMASVSSWKPPPPVKAASVRPSEPVKIPEAPPPAEPATPEVSAPTDAMAEALKKARDRARERTRR